MIKSLFLPFLILILGSCNSTKNRSISDDVAAFIESNSSISYFGYVDVTSILKKSEYQSIEKFGSEIAKEVIVFEKLINKDQPIFFAVETMTDLKGNVPLIYAFAEVSNRDSFVENIQKKGFEMDKSEAYDFHESGDFAFAVTDNRIVFVSKPGLRNHRQIIENTLESLEGEFTKNKVKEILTTKGDIVLGTDLATAYNGLKNSIHQNASKKSELQKMTKNCYSQAVLTFNSGSIEILLRNFLSNELKSYFVMDSNANNIVSKLGSGPTQAAFAMNADMNKIQLFMDQFAPNLIEEIGKNAGGQAQFALAMLGDEGLAGLFSGKLGIALMGKPNNSDAFKPEFNFYIELGNSVLPMVKEMVESLGTNLAKITLTGRNLNGFSSASFLPGNNGLNLPKGCENFGKKPISGFINFDGLDTRNFDLDGKERYFKLFGYLMFEMDAEEGLIHFDVKNKKRNVLKVLIDEASQDIKDHVNS